MNIFKYWLWKRKKKKRIKWPKKFKTLVAPIDIPYAELNVIIKCQTDLKKENAH